MVLEVGVASLSHGQAQRLCVLNDCAPDSFLHFSETLLFYLSGYIFIEKNSVIEMLPVFSSNLNLLPGKIPCYYVERSNTHMYRKAHIFVYVNIYITDISASINHLSM